MVRVISVHNFPKQDISSVDEVVDFAAVPPDILLLVQSDHTILVRDLSVLGDDGFIIPTVDQAVKIIYSVKGNYIGTLERKLTRNGVNVCQVRIYLNWESLKKYNELPPMRARIAGRVTPLSQNHEGLEMIEIPAQNVPDNIACCPERFNNSGIISNLSEQFLLTSWVSCAAFGLLMEICRKMVQLSGNLILSSKNILVIYKLCIQMHDISKMCFVDFDQMPFDCLLSFVPSRIHFVENMVAVQNHEFLHVFNIVSTLSVSEAEAGETEFPGKDIEFFPPCLSRISKNQIAINYDRLIEENKGMNCSHLPETFRKTGKTSVAKRIAESHRELSKINPLSFPLRHDFPTIAIHKSLESKSPDVQKQNPFLTGQDLNVNLIVTSTFENARVHYKIENLLQYQLMPLMLGSTTNRDMQEKFTCLKLKPYYAHHVESTSKKVKTLESEHSSSCKTIVCFFGTQQEGYLHRFEYDSDGGYQTRLQSFTIYPFTAPVIDVEMEDSLLHALTDTGLETYTMRAAYYLMKSDDRSACPSEDDPVCLIGLRPFVNVFKLCLTNEQLVLFANSDESSCNGAWTLYKLNLSSPSSVWYDFLSAAEENKWEAPATYSHLVGEGHLVLKTYLSSRKWVSQMNKFKDHIHSPVPFINQKERNLCEKLFRESCALLGDLHIINGDFIKSSNYYTMSGYKICDIARRINALKEGIPTQFRMNYDEKTIRLGLIFHLKKTLSLSDEKYCSFAGNREEFYNPEIGNVVNILLDYLEKEDDPSISDLVLDSVVLREYSTDRILKIMKNILTKSSPPQEKDALTLALMCIQRDQVEQAKTVLLTIAAEPLQDILQKYYHLLFEENNRTRVISFTELSTVLIETYPVVIGKILSYLVIERRVLTLSGLLNIFLEILPSGTVQSKNSSTVLQIVLENYFKYCTKMCAPKSFDIKSSEAVKILIRIYLTFLTQKGKLTREWDDEDEMLFSKYRPNYLDHLPPFGPEFKELFSPEPKADSSDVEKDLNRILFRIQGLLSIKNLPTDYIMEVRNYVNKQENVYGSLSLQILTAATSQEVLQLLINFAPQAVVPYMKGCPKDVDDWRFAVKQLRIKIGVTNDDSSSKSNLQQILKDLLLHGAKNLEIEDLVDALPRDLEDGEKYLTIAQNNAQANHIRTLIMTTGKQLQMTLYE